MVLRTGEEAEEESISPESLVLGCCDITWMVKRRLWATNAVHYNDNLTVLTAEITSDLSGSFRARSSDRNKVTP
jgi:hypothetical protein